MKASENVAPLNDSPIPDVSILDSVSGRFTTVLRIALDKTCPRSHVLELYDVFGQDFFVKFLDIFAGSTIKVPTKKEIETCMRQVAIFLSIKREKAASRPRVVRELAERYYISAGEVRKIYADIAGVIRRGGYIIP